MPVRGEPLPTISSEFFPALLASLLDAVITIDVRGRLTGCNAAAERMFGHSATEVLGQDVGVLIALPYRRAADEPFDRYLATDRSSSLGRAQRVDGRRAGRAARSARQRPDPEPRWRDGRTSARRRRCSR